MTFLEKSKEFLERKSDLLRGTSAAVALGVFAWTFFGEAVMEKFFPTPPILTVHDFFVGDVKQGEKVRVEAVITKTRDDCNATIKMQYTGADGILHALTAEQTASPKAERYSWVQMLPTDPTMPVGPARLYGIISYHHPSDETCNRTYTTVERPFNVLPKDDENDG